MLLWNWFLAKKKRDVEKREEAARAVHAGWRKLGEARKVAHAAGA